MNSILVLLTGVFLLSGLMLMSIPDDAFAGKGEKRINITVKDFNGKNYSGISCQLFELDSTTPIGDAKVTNNGGKAGINFPDFHIQVIVMCGEITAPPTLTLKHTSSALIVHP